MADDHFYVGIDLGTTNSVIAWGRTVRRSGMFEPETLDVEFLDTGKHSVRRPLLPSVVYFQENGAPVIGEHARTDAYRSQPHLVVKSVKSMMGSGKDVSVDRKEYSPAYISSLILNQLRAATQDKFGKQVDDVIITVPASFTPDMRQDTLDAARMAGFKVTNADGSDRDILLDEPRAALYYLIHQQQMDEIPSSIIDLSTQKTVLIFDLGGGTLDVSLHRVQADYDTLEMDVEDIAISRYTRIGGDNFDKLIADYFEKDFSTKAGIQIDSIPEEYIRREIRSVLLLEAEQKKRELNDQFAQGMRQQATMSMLKPTITVKVQIPNLYDNRPYSKPRFGWSDLESIVAPLLGMELEISSVDHFEDLHDDQSNNIIYPILDVLHKAVKRLGHMPKIDAVFLNGGMTRFIPVRDRLEKFFGLQPITILDPDKSVALGASLYHYALHQGKKPRSVIQAETIGIEVEGNYVKHLVPAGTVLPLKTPIVIENFFIREGTSGLTIPFYRGEGKEPSFPNVKLLERVVKLPYACQKDERLHAEVSVDNNKILTFRGFLISDPKVAIEILVQSAGDIEPEPIKEVLPRVVPEKKNIPSPTIPLTKKKETPKTHPSISFPDALVHLKRAQSAGKSSRKSAEKRIVGAKNREELIESFSDFLSNALPEDVLSNDTLYIRVILLLGRLVSLCPDHPANGKALSALVKVCKMRSGNNEKDKKYLKQVVNMTMVSFTRMGNPGAEQVILDLLNDPDVDGIEHNALAALTVVSRSANAFTACANYLSHKRNAVRKVAALAVGKFVSNDHLLDQIPGSSVVSVINQLLRLLKEENDELSLEAYIYGIAEIANSHSSHHSVISNELQTEIQQVLEGKLMRLDYLGFLGKKKQHLKSTLNMAIDMVKGIQLQEEQVRALLSLRSLLDTVDDEDE